MARSQMSLNRWALACIAVLALLFLLAAGNASAAQNFDQARAADVGVSENGTSRPTGWDQPGECIKSVQRWITGAGGRMAGGGAYSAYVNSPADLIATGSAAVAAQAVKGDVIQYTYNPNRNTYANGVHTVMVVANNGNGTLRIVQSNAPAGSGRVSVVDGWRPAPPANFTAYLWRFGQVYAGGSTDLYFVKTKNTGSGRVEAFTATAGSGYSTGVSSATRFSPGDEANGWFGLLPNTDLYFVKTKNTGSGRIEAFTASRDSGYQSGVSSATRFSPGDANNGWFGLLPNTDLYFIKTKNTGSGRVEAFTATRASGYQSGMSTAVPRFSPGDADNGWFGLLPNGDVYFVKTKNTGSGRIEAFTATAASGYQTGVSSATRFSPGDASNGWFRMLPNNDVYFVKTRNTGSGKVEVHTATRASNYQSGISSAAPRFSPADANNGWFGLLG